MLLCHPVGRTQFKAFLIPELCYPTGITEKQKGTNFREIKDDLYADAEKKSEQTNLYFDSILQSKAYETASKKYGISLNR